MIVFLKDFFVKVHHFEKKKVDNKSTKNYPACKDLKEGGPGSELNMWEKNLSYFSLYYHFCIVRLIMLCFVCLV